MTMQEKGIIVAWIILRTIPVVQVVVQVVVRALGGSGSGEWVAWFRGLEVEQVVEGAEVAEIDIELNGYTHVSMNNLTLLT